MKLNGIVVVAALLAAPAYAQYTTSAHITVQTADQGRVQAQAFSNQALSSSADVVLVGGPGGVGGAGHASADIPSGRLIISAATQHADSSTSLSSSYAVGEAQLTDHLFFSVAGATPDTLTRLGFHITGSARSSTTIVQPHDLLLNAGYGDRYHINNAINVLWTVRPNQTLIVERPTDGFSSASDYDFEALAWFNIYGDSGFANPIFYALFGSENLFGFPGVFDANIELVVPDDSALSRSFSRISAVNSPRVTVTSSSGVFPTTNVVPLASSVPEPSAWTLMIAGFALVGCSVRRRRDAGRLASSIAQTKALAAGHETS